MKQFYSIDAGEYLVGICINEKIKECEIWFPAKDKGTDILLTNKNDHKKSVSLQVKYSNDHLPEPQHSSDDRDHYRSFGFWNFGQTAIKSRMGKDSVDFWVIAMHSFSEKETDCIVITPAELYERFSKFKIEGKKPSTYFWITKDKKCFETRGLKEPQKKLLKEGNYDSFEPERNFTSFLNNWKPVKQILGV
jgi:hypothetical protein